jgi:hypothetical protein
MWDTVTPRSVGPTVKMPVDWDHTSRPWEVPMASRAPGGAVAGGAVVVGAGGTVVGGVATR